MGAPANLLDETFEGQGYKAMTGTTQVNGTSILDPDLSTALIGTPHSSYPGNGIPNTPPGWGDQCLRCVSQGVDTEIRKLHTLASASTGTVWFRDEIYIASEAIPDGGESHFFTAWNAAFTSNLFHIKLRRDLPDLKIQFVLNDGGTPLVVSYIVAPYTVPRKYVCEVMFNLVTHDYECRINGVFVGSGTLASATQTQFQLVVVGSSIFVTAGPTTTIYHDNVGIGDQGWLEPSLSTIARIDTAVRRPIIIDSFSRSLTGVGAGTAESGLDPTKAWTTISGSDANVNVDGSALIFTPDTGFWVGRVGSLSQAPIVEIEIEVSNYGPTTSLFREMSVYPRIHDMNNFYECRYNNDQNMTDSSFNCQIVKNSVGSASVLRQGPVGGSMRLSEFRLKGRVETTPFGVIIRVKVWSIYAQEPPDWLFSVLDDAADRHESGRLGLKMRNHSASDTRVEYFQAYSYENPPSAPALYLGDNA